MICTIEIIYVYTKKNGFKIDQFTVSLVGIKFFLVYKERKRKKLRLERYYSYVDFERRKQLNDYPRQQQTSMSMRTRCSFYMVEEEEDDLVFIIVCAWAAATYDASNNMCR